MENCDKKIEGTMPGVVNNYKYLDSLQIFNGNRKMV